MRMEPVCPFLRAGGPEMMLETLIRFLRVLLRAHEHRLLILLNRYHDVAIVAESFSEKAVPACNDSLGQVECIGHCNINTHAAKSKTLRLVYDSIAPIVDKIHLRCHEMCGITEQCDAGFCFPFQADG